MCIIVTNFTPILYYILVRISFFLIFALKNLSSIDRESGGGGGGATQFSKQTSVKK
jgi:hypothetical protein